MFWRQKRVARASEGAAGPILMQRPAGGPWSQTNRLALRRAGAGAAEEKALMLRLLSTAPATTNRLPALTLCGLAPATPSATATLSATKHGAVEAAGQREHEHEHEHEHEGGAAWRAIGPR